MKIILFEGQPGSGKSTLSRGFCKELDLKKINYRLITEHEQDTKIFGDYWDNIGAKPQETIISFLSSWSRFINSVHSQQVIILDHSLLNQVQFLLAINTPNSKIEEFFSKVVELFSKVDIHMIFFDGDSNVIINRVNKVRKDGWGERVIELLEATPYQVNKNRKGLNGMVDFFADTQILKRELLTCWPYPLTKIDVTAGNWSKYSTIINKIRLS